MTYNLKDKRSVEIRLLANSDNDNLFDYFQNLSIESRSRFGPHLFDKETIDIICTEPNNDTLRYVAIDNSSKQIVAYMLIKQGMIEWDEERYATRNQAYDHASSVTFAPSVADAWQSSGLGSLMNDLIEDDLDKRKIRSIILWGGVQSSNLKAVNFYKKLGYQYIASFLHNNKDNHDMVKQLF
jgi:ribosomal protein S18 acetylase RimI-like enzyme